MINVVLFYIGAALLVLGGILDVIAAIGLFRLRDFYARLHAATFGTIGGGVYPLLGLVLITLGLDMDVNSKAAFAGVALTAALILFLGTPAGSHALARGVYRSREVEPQVVKDELRERQERGGGE